MYLVNQELTSSPACASKRNITEHASQLGPSSKLAKVSTDTNLGNKLFGGVLQFDKGNGISKVGDMANFLIYLHELKDVDHPPLWVIGQLFSPQGLE